MKNKWLFAVVLVTVIAAIRIITAQDEATQADKREYSLLPKDKEGNYPIQIPEYDGVDHLIVLSDRWLILLINNTEEIVKKVDEKTKGEYMKAVDKWEASLKSGGKPLWVEFKDRIEPFQKSFYAQSRVEVGEFNYDQAKNYGITSQDDSDYQERTPPPRMTRYVTSLADKLIPGELETHWDHYCYLEMPKPLKSGKTYTVDFDNKRSVTFKFDEKATISRAIKVNQVGYIPGNKANKAFLAAYLMEFGPLDFSSNKEFSVIDVKNGQVVHTGPIKLKQKNPYVIDEKTATVPKRYFYGEDIYEMDLSPILREGNYFITIPGVGRSWPFKIAHDGLAEAYYVATRGMYHQRCGIAIKEPYSSWPRIQCHTEPVYESEAVPFVEPMKIPDGYEVFDVIGHTINYSKPHTDVVGGWHDAADWDRRIPHYANIYDFLYAYESAPQKFVDNQLNIPESGNGIPDLLDEVEYGLVIWKRSMNKEGGVSGCVETWTHPTINDPNIHYALSKNTRWASLFYAAGAAHYAELVRAFDAAKSKEYLDSAILAYEYGMNPKNSLGTITINAAKDRGEGTPYSMTFTEKDDDQIPYRIHAKLRLYLATGDKNYISDISDLFAKAIPPMVWPFRPFDYSSWLYWPIFDARFDGLIDEKTRKKWREHYLDIADKMLKFSKESAYEHSWPNYQDFWMGWGSTTMSNQARNLMMGYLLTKNENYRNAAISNLNFMYGANPMGMCWTTGLGYSYPIHIQDDVSRFDGILDPVPGIQIFGVTERATPPEQLYDAMWKMKDGTTAKEIQFIKDANMKVPIWRRWWVHPYYNTAQNEFTVFETMSTPTVCLGLLLPDGWKPSEELKNKKPRKDDLLFGFWSMP